MERCPVIILNQIITDTIWSCPACHGGAYEYKILSVVIIIAHRPVKFQGSDIFVFVGDHNLQVGKQNYMSFALKSGMKPLSNGTLPLSAQMPHIITLPGKDRCI